jgi:large subunit ribosomal protein L10
MKDTLEGPILLAFSKDDPGAAARVIKDFSKEHDALKAVSLSTNGELLPATDLLRLADLPSLSQAQAMFLGVLIAPLTKVAYVLTEPAALIVRAMSAQASKDAG